MQNAKLWNPPAADDYFYGSVGKVFFCFVVSLFVWSVALGANIQTMPLKEGFYSPPPKCGIRCFWWWLNGNVSKKAITRDLEAMKAKGFSGAIIFDAGGADQSGNSQVPAGPTFGSPKWRDLFKQAVQEADRLGLELSLNIQSGWNLGGPTVTPEMAAKKLTWKEIQAAGPLAYDQKLPQPESKDGFYRDIAVLAFPMKEELLNQGGENASRPAACQPIRDLYLKAMFKELGRSAPDCRFLLNDVPATDGEEDTENKNIVDITEKMDAEGRLRWEAPKGRWCILRFGYTIAGKGVSTYSAGWEGYVLDYLGKRPFEWYWRENVEPLLSEIGPLAGQTLKYLYSDSWECGGMNWTEDFAAEFQKRRGYDPIAYLPVIAGKIVDNRGVSNRFLADFRKTIGDCVAENHYQSFAKLAHSHNMGIHPESGGPHAGPIDAIKCLGRNDMAMGEFWAVSPHRPKAVDRFFVKQSSSAAHIYGKKLVGAESFTTIGPHWNDVFWSSQKPSFDHEVCGGLNLVFVHTFTCSPEEMGIPGQEYFAGTHFNPNITWWNEAEGVISYLNRCQYLLQQGKFAADVLYYYGDHVPNLVQLKEKDPAQVMPGYDYDVTNEEVLLSAGVKNGSIILPSGMSYRLLVLPDHKVLSLAAAEKIAELAVAGAVILGPKPQRTASLTGYPASEHRLNQIAERLWGANCGKEGENSVGKGKIIWGKTGREVLGEMAILPDFSMENAPSTATLDYIHYTIQDADVYFVCNQTEEAVDVCCSFRVSGKQPELWDPLTGVIWEAEAFRQENGRTVIPLEFSPYGSLFVVFGKPIPAEKNGRGVKNFVDYKPRQEIAGPWQVSFDPRWGGPVNVIFQELISWTEHPDKAIQFYSGKATYRTDFTFTDAISKGRHYALDLGEVLDIGITRVRLNGMDLGILWTKPFRANIIDDALKTGQNHLEVEVVNSWRNRLVGDRDLPEKERLTQTNITIRPEWQLLESGLLGPVQILAGD